MGKFWKQGVAMLALSAAAGVLCVSGALAKPPSGGGGDGGTGGGTIYYLASGYELNSMASDGTAKSLLPANVEGAPSRLLHGGFRWFSQLRFTSGSVAFYPDGSPRWELFAVREDGEESVTVQLTNDPRLQFLGNIHYAGCVRWAPGEKQDSGMIAGVAQRWVLVEEQWQVDPDSIGVYTATVWFDEHGNVTGLASPPGLLVQLPGGPDLYPIPDFDWSPDLSRIVYSTSDGTELRIVDVVTGDFSTLASAGNDGGRHSAVWSPDGSLIAFSNGRGSIYTIRHDGTGQKEIIRRSPSSGFFLPQWSPTGSHLACQYWYWTQADTYAVYRFTASGSGKTNLTGILQRAEPVAWR